MHNKNKICVSEKYKLEMLEQNNVVRPTQFTQFFLPELLILLTKVFIWCFD